MNFSNAWSNPDVKKIVQEIHNKFSLEHPELNLTYNDILEVIDSEFKMCKEEIIKGTYKDYESFTKEIWLQYLATFVVRKKDRIDKMAKGYEKVLSKLGKLNESTTEL